jgi:hypothetical protein
MDYSTNHRESNPELSGQHQKNYFTSNTENNLHTNHSDIDVMATNQIQQQHHFGGGFTKTDDFKIQDIKTIPPYSNHSSSNGTNKTTCTTLKDEKCDDQESTDSNFFTTSSIHESHSSRKSLTKK